MKLVKSETDKWVTGVCGGLGDYLGVDPTIVRAIFGVSVVLSFGTTLVIYFILSLIIPRDYF